MQEIIEFFELLGMPLERTEEIPWGHSEEEGKKEVWRHNKEKGGYVMFWRGENMNGDDAIFGKVNFPGGWHPIYISGPIEGWMGEHAPKLVRGAPKDWEAPAIAMYPPPPVPRLTAMEQLISTCLRSPNVTLADHQGNILKRGRGR